MDELENKLGAILGDPEMMKKIAAFAQTLSPQEATQDSAHPPKAAPLPDFDASMLQKLSGIAGQTGIDQNQRKLLSALRPYLNSHRISKLERAMRAAKMASMAGVFLGTSSGR